ncbi:hypothetical protein [Methanolobus psychrotolerans]|nr:hypothetical protein [Methanolobus psychrotolerans]
MGLLEVDGQLGVDMAFCGILPEKELIYTALFSKTYGVFTVLTLRNSEPK